MNLYWTEQASSQLEEAYEFIAEDNPDTAKKLVETVLGALEVLAGFPEMGRPGRIAGTRELVIQSTPYIVAYRLRRGTIRILAVMHGAQRWPSRFS